MMARSARDVEFFLSSLLGDEGLLRATAQRDPRFVPMPWNEKTLQQKNALTVGWYGTGSLSRVVVPVLSPPFLRYVNDALFPCTPGPRRALLKAVSALESLGHRAVRVDPEQSGINRAYGLFNEFLSAAGDEWRKEVARDAPTDRDGNGWGTRNLK